MMVDSSLVSASLGIGIMFGAFIAIFVYTYFFLVLYSNRINRMRQFIVEIGYAQECEEKEEERRKEKKSAWRRWLDL